MMKRLIVSLALLVTACATTQTSDVDVRAAMSGFMDALNSLDADRIATYFVDDVTAFVPVAQGDRVNGKPALVDIFRKYCETTKKTMSRTNIVPEDLRVDHFGDVAVVTFNVRSAAGVSRRTFIFHHERGTWLITHFHASNFK